MLGCVEHEPSIFVQFDECGIIVIGYLVTVDL